MTFAELAKSVPTLIELLFDYITSFYILGVALVTLVVCVIIYLDKIREFTYYNLSWQLFLKEIWLKILFIYLFFNAVTFLSHNSYVQSSWEENQLQTYLDEQEDIIVDNTLLKQITIYNDDLTHGQVIILNGDSLDKVDVTVKYDPDFDEPKLTYVALNNDITYLSKKPMYKKGEKVNHKLVLPIEYNDNPIPIEYIDNQE